MTRNYFSISGRNVQWMVKQTDLKERAFNLKLFRPFNFDCMIFLGGLIAILLKGPKSEKNADFFTILEKMMDKTEKYGKYWLSRYTNVTFWLTPIMY